MNVVEEVARLGNGTRQQFREKTNVEECALDMLPQTVLDNGVAIEFPLVCVNYETDTAKGIERNTQRQGEGAKEMPDAMLNGQKSICHESAILEESQQQEIDDYARRGV